MSTPHPVSRFADLYPAGGVVLSSSVPSESSLAESSVTCLLHDGEGKIHLRSGHLPVVTVGHNEPVACAVGSLAQSLSPATTIGGLLPLGRLFGADGPGREFFQLAHDLVFRLPGIRAMLTPYGTVPASPENMRRALARGAALLVYPGGDHETYRASWHSAEIDFAHRTGFVRLALRHGMRIVPVVSIGGQETALFLGQGEHIARWLHLHRLLRIDVAPVQIAPPWGVTVLDLPGQLPLPAKTSIEVLPPIDLRAELGGAGGDREEGYELVTGRMQRALSALDEARALPLIG